MIEIGTMGRDDIDFAVELTNSVNWGYAKDDFIRMLSWEPAGCFIALKDDKMCAFTTTINYGKLGWIGNVCVSRRFRKSGIGKSIVAHSMGYLNSMGVRTIRLCSYLDKREFYTKLGFKEEGLARVFLKEDLAGIPEEAREKGKGSGIRGMDQGDLEDTISLDRKMFGHDRSRLLMRVHEDFPRLCFISEKAEGGYIMGTDSAGTGEIGPWICSPDTENGDAESLLHALLEAFITPVASVTVPMANRNSMEILKNMGFVQEYDVAVMRSGEPDE
ncbi:MAG: GNAT family N-acetyltransferase, partial [Thermoplasmata archaeon]|nr:GNAT family N-acetyltransferase [Thermoplasmata archaeon]